MDWAAVALMVAERSGLSAVLTGARGEVLMIAPAAERVLGWKLGGGEQHLAAFVPQEAQNVARAALERARAGELRVLSLRVFTARGTAVARFSSAVVGGGEDQGVLLVLEHLAPLVGVPATSEYDYEVEGLARQEYRLLRVWQPGAAAAPAEGKCFEVLHGLQGPCEKCPLSRSETRRVQVSVGRQAPQDYLITSATLQGEDGALVSVRRVSTASFSAVMQARLDELAERAQLSKRERAVFVQLMEGRAVHEIAKELAISPRTVKFHQANVLQKLGADSRADLMRLVF